MWNPTVWLTLAMALISVPVPAVAASVRSYSSSPWPEEDKCLTGYNMCDKNAYCYKTSGSYKCVCKPGFKGDGFKCRPSVSPPDPPNPSNSIQRYSDTSMQKSSYRSIIHELIPQVRPNPPPTPTYPTPTSTIGLGSSFPSFTWWPRISTSTKTPFTPSSTMSKFLTSSQTRFPSSSTTSIPISTSQVTP